MNARTPALLTAIGTITLLPACQAQPGSQPAPPSAAAMAPGHTEGGGSSTLALIQARRVGFPQFPSISPDGSVVVFAYAGDLWSVETSGGIATRLTAHPADEGRSAFSPDGSSLAFESERDGPRNLYVMPVAHTPAGLVAGDAARVTQSDRPQTLAGFSADGSELFFAASHEPAIFRSSRMYRAPVTGDGPTRRITDAYGAAPHASPDGTALLFTRGGGDQYRPKYTGASANDIYRLNAQDGTFARLTQHASRDTDAYALPDGSVVFVSSRSGQFNLWKLPAGVADSAAVQITDFKPAQGEASIAHGVRDLSLAPGGWHGVFVVWDTMYVVNLKEAKPTPLAVPASLSGDFAQLDFARINIGKQVNEAALSPDGKTMAVVARGEVFVRGTDKDRPTRRVTDTHARERDPAWSADGKTLYFASDATGRYGVYAATVTLALEDIRPKEDKPDEPAPEEAKKDADTPQPDGAAAAPADPAAEPAPAAGDQQAAANTEKKQEPKKDKKPDHAKRWAESLRFEIKPLIVGSEETVAPLPSPDGKKLLITRGLGDLILVDLEKLAAGAPDAERLLLDSWNEPDAEWASDSRHIVYAVSDLNFNSDIWLLDTSDPGAKPVNLTRHPDDDGSPRLSADGRVLIFLSDRDADANGDADVYAINLERRLDGLRPYELADYFKEAAEKAKKRKPLGAEAEKKPDAKSGEKPPEGAAEGEAKPAEGERKPEDKPKPAEPLKFDADDAYLRVRRITTLPGGEGDLALTPGGDRIIFSASIDGQNSLFSVDYKGSERKTIQSGGASSVSVNITGEKVVCVSGGEASIGKPAGGDAEKVAIDAPVTIDIERQQGQKFSEAARTLGDRFYHPTLKGLDWKALMSRYQALAKQTRTDPEFNRVVLMLFGELDGSHLGISGGRDTGGQGQAVGYLGIEYVPDPDGYKITRVMAKSPASRASSQLEPGDVITSINGVAVAAAGGGPTTDLMAALAGTAGQETLLELRRADPAKPGTVLITPANSGADSSYRYEDEVARRTALVGQLSNGRLGYLHIQGMSMPSVRDFERDLFAAADGKDGLIIDVRDNGGGWTADILLASLTAPQHAYTTPRGVDPSGVARDTYPRDRRLIYAYTRPISVLCNFNSYSNAEIFSHAIKTIGRGKLVGTPTHGAVISTGGFQLIDGTSVRLPFRGWYLPDDTDMENHGAVPDIEVWQTPEDEVAGRDAQIEAAVKELLQRVGTQRVGAR